MLDKLMKSVLEQDTAAIVICSTEHEIMYMNPAAKIKYAGRGGESLVGKNLLACHNADSKEKIEKVIEWFRKDEKNNIVFTFHNEKENRDVYMVALRDENNQLIGYYEKHEYRNPETSVPYNLT